ncbi:MAG: phosphoribosylamine--glycine ligase [Acidobacteriaceae bacterium]
MKLLILGGGGREHAIVWKLLQSSRATEIVCAPGNAGICAEAEARVRCVPVDLNSLDDIVRVAIEEQPDLTVVGPEQPLTLGVVDEFERRGWRIFGPSKVAARLESSKVFAKEFMQRHQIPTPKYAVCTSLQDVEDALPLFTAPIVVKADGLAAGKGVLIAASREEAQQISAEMLAGRTLAGAGSRLLLEEFVEGEELSLLCLSDGRQLAPLAAAQDYKRVGEGDTGANTGGMGAYSTDTLLEPEMREWVLAHIARPAIAGMAAEGAPFKGILYCGLMLTARGPLVLEFNARFGDPETQPLLMRLHSDLLDALEAVVDERIESLALEWTPEVALGVVMASGGYPGSFESGQPITGIEAAEATGAKVFQAGTALNNDNHSDSHIVTCGGRVLCVTALGADLEAAAAKAYSAVEKISFEHSYYRRDIGQ